MLEIRVWDPFIRLFHWSLAAAFTANALFVDDESALHIYLGYAILALVLARVVWGFVGTAHARFASFPPSRSGAYGQLIDMATGRTTRHIGHTPLGALMIYNLLLSLLVVCLSGYLMTTDMFAAAGWPEEMHEAAVAWTEMSVLLHIGAVIVESRRSGVNLPRAMVTGTKRFPH